MNCSEVRTHLPALLYGDLKPNEVAAVEHHLTTCPACRRERAEFQQVRQALATVPVPRVEVDVPRLYLEAAQRQAGRARRWRRAAVALGAVAALLLLALGLRLEVRLEARQLVVRWGPAPAGQVEPAPKGPPVPPAHAGLERVNRPATPGSRKALEERLRLLDELIHALAADVEDRDGRRRQDVAELRERLDGLRRHGSETERHLAALYAAHLTLVKKGDRE